MGVTHSYVLMVGGQLCVTACDRGCLKIEEKMRIVYALIERPLIPMTFWCCVTFLFWNSKRRSITKPMHCLAYEFSFISLSILPFLEIGLKLWRFPDKTYKATHCVNSRPVARILLYGGFTSSPPSQCWVSGCDPRKFFEIVHARRWVVMHFWNEKHIML